jgi:hypothetical protein
LFDQIGRGKRIRTSDLTAPNLVGQVYLIK